MNQTFTIQVALYHERAGRLGCQHNIHAFNQLEVGFHTFNISIDQFDMQFRGPITLSLTSLQGTIFERLTSNLLSRSQR